jgi:hypothetical protein
VAGVDHPPVDADLDRAEQPEIHHHGDHHPGR